MRFDLYRGENDHQVFWETAPYCDHRLLLRVKGEPYWQAYNGPQLIYAQIGITNVLNFLASQGELWKCSTRARWERNPDTSDGMPQVLKAVPTALGDRA